MEGCSFQRAVREEGEVAKHANTGFGDHPLLEPPPKTSREVTLPTRPLSAESGFSHCMCLLIHSILYFLYLLLFLLSTHTHTHTLLLR